MRLRQDIVQQFEQESGLSFDDKTLLLAALTHRSYKNEHPRATGEDNQRLEFLGDAVLDFICGEYLYAMFPMAKEGRLTRLRASLVRTETLADYAIACGIADSLMLGRGEEDNRGRERPTNLCAAFEAVMGALYLDKGIEPVADYVIPMFEKTLELVIEQESYKDAKSRLQEFCQAQFGNTPVYVTVDEYGPDHEKTFVIAVHVNDEQISLATGSSKRTAAQVAAARALQTLEAR